MPAGRSTHAARSEMFLDRGSMAHIDHLLDEALVETFPASDPISVYLEDKQEGSARGKTDLSRTRS